MTRLVPLALAFCLLSCTSQPTVAQSFSFPDAFPGVTFTGPVELSVAPGQPDRVYVVEQGGLGAGSRSRVQTLALGDTQATTFVDLTDRVLAGGEQGLLGLAFHPDYEANGKLYVNYTASNPRRTVIAELERSADNPLVTNSEIHRVLLEIAQPFSNHNGGKIAFGPDGFLYISVGDGGSGGDPQNNAQTRSTLLGKLLRIDVDQQTVGGPAYGIPPDNPFVGNTQGWREEIYAFGLRNAWKFSFDSQTGDLWLGDVGQGTWEEINLITNGGNYGWKQVEGPACFVGGCDLSAYVPPVFFYGHNNAGGFSITGGFVYHGTAAPSLQGRYLFADFVSSKLWLLNTDARPATSLLLTTNINNIAAVSEGPDGEAYVLSYAGMIHKIVQNGVDTGEAPGRLTAPTLEMTGPHPFRGQTTVAATLPAGGTFHVSLHDALGRAVRTLFDGTASAAAPVELSIDGQDLAAGVYLVRLDAGDAGAVVRRIVRAE
jgi:glucose/arabinose dehydrogenase